MKRFILFAFDDYYPGGGMNDSRGSFDTIEEAAAYVATMKSKLGYFPDNVEVLDTQTGDVREWSTHRQAWLP